MSETLRHISLFSGIGGFDRGFEQAGIATVAQVEIDPAARSVLAAHWPTVWRWDDIRTLHGADLPDAEIVSFGSPCQGLSIAGKRAGLRDERSNVFYEAIRVIAEQRHAGGQCLPALAVWENVPHALSSNAGRDFAAVLAAFRNIGARDLAWRIVDAAYCGVAQRRRRLFLVADFAGERAGQVLFESASVPGHPAPRPEAGERVTGSLADSAGNRGWSSSVDCQMWVAQSEVDAAYALRSREDNIKADGTDNLIVGPLQAHTPAHGHAMTTQQAANSGYLIATSSGETAHALTSTYGRQVDSSDRNGGPPNLVYQTNHTYALTNPGSGGRTHSRQIATSQAVRRLTPVECERLQGFPDDWTRVGMRDGQIVGQSDSARYRQLGNAVCVAVAVRIGRWIRDAWDGEAPG